MFFTLSEPSFPYRRHHSNWDKLLCNPGGVVSTPGRSFLFQSFLTSTVVPREGLSSCPDIKHLAWLCRWNTNRKETQSSRNFQSSRTTFVIMMYNKFPQNIVAWNNIDWITISLGQDQDAATWLPLPQSLSSGCSQPVSWGCSLNWKLNCRGSTWTHTHMDLDPLPHGRLYMAACSLQSKRSTREERRVFSTKAKIYFIS